jgi:hypothetical protein
MGHPLPIWLRAFFLLIAIQALVVAAGIVWPSLIPLLVPWEASPLNARFIGALYAMGALSALLCLNARHYAEVRIILVEIGLITLLVLLITLLRLGEFAPPRAFPIGWLISYAADPLLAALLLWLMRGRDQLPSGRGPLAPLFAVYAAALGLVGLALLGLPALAARMWPWQLSEALGQLYSAFFLGLAVCAWLAAREPRWEGVRLYLAANLALAVLVIVVSLLNADRFNGGIATWVWYAFWLAWAAASTSALLRRPGRLALKATLP